jgi:hypothetical protein
MRIGTAGVILAALFFTGCQSAPATYPEPPADTYTAVTVEATIGTETMPLTGAAVDQTFLDASRATPLLGRAFREGDFREGASPTVMVSHDLWATRLGSSPEIIGRTIDLDDRPTVVIGIMPRGFHVPDGAAFWVPRRAS